MATASLPPRLSPSAIDRYRSCPRRYLWQDVERRPTDNQPSAELAVGNAVHKVLEVLFRLHVDERTVGAAHQLLRSVWPDFRKPGTFTSREHEAAAGRDGLDMLSRFIAQHDMTAQPLKLEHWLEIKLPNGTRLATRIDRVDRTETGGLHLIDYKTGKHQVEDAHELSRDSAAMIHLVAAEKASGTIVERVSHFYLRSGDVVSWEPEREDVDTTGDRLRELLTTMNLDEEFEAAPGPLCSWCPFALQCEAVPASDLADYRPVENLPF